MGGDGIHPDLRIDVENSENVLLLAPDKKKQSMVPYNVTVSTFVSDSFNASYLAQPSDDRRSNSFTSGCAISSLILGAGMLGIPYAIRQGGWVALATNFIVAWICSYTAKLLVKSMYETSYHSGNKHRLRVDFPGIGEAAFKKPGRVFIEIMQTVEMFGGTIMYIILLGTTTKELFGCVLQLKFNAVTSIMCIFILPMLFIRRVSVLSTFSVVAGVCCVFAVLVEFVSAFSHYSMWKLSNVEAFNHKTFPVGFGIIVLSYAGHAALPSIEGSMKKPQHYNTVVDVSFLVAAIIKGVLGVCWVLLYGENTDQVATVNMKGLIFGRTANVFVIINTFLTLPLVMRVVSEICDEKLLRLFPQSNKMSGWLWMLFTRPLLLGFGLLISIFVPQFGLLMGLLGSISGTSLSFICPCLCYMKIHWKRLKIYEIVISCFIILFGIVAGALGMFFSSKELLKSFLK